MKKALSLVLSVLLVLGVLPLAAAPVRAANVDSGTCGDNLTWTLDDTGTLTISGSGKMKNYEYYGENQAPWRSYPVKKAVLQSGVMSVGECAFYHRTELTSVTIPNSVTSIERYAFSGCSGLTSIKIPDSVTSIGNFAFESCTGLTSVTIPDSVTDIGNGAFNNCTGLTSVSIPGSVTSIEFCTFSGCTGLTSVTIGNGVTSIRESAFAGCTGLTSVTIPEGVKKISWYAFAGCTGLTSVTIPNSVTEIDLYAYSGCTGLTSVTIPNSVTKIDSYAYSGCTGLTDVVLPEGLSKIGQYAFNGCTALTAITVPGKVTTISEGVFMNCSGLTKVTLPVGLKIIETHAFRYSKSLKSVAVPYTVTEIGAYAFADCDKLESITIPKSVTKIGSSAVIPQATIIGAKGSAAETFAQKNGNLFKIICESGHTWDAGTVKTVSTCTEDGEKAFICAVCGDTKTEPIPATGHNYGAWNKLNATQHQRVCDNNKSHVEKENHAWNSGVITIAATCTTGGVKTYTCTVCGATKTESVSKTGHAYGAWTRLNDTQHQRVCANDKSHVEKENHKWNNGVITTPATCTKDGVKTYACTVCGATKTETVGKTVHNYGAWTKLNDTQHQRVCAYDDSHIEKANHTWDGGVITTAATCTKDGVRTYTCAVCNGTKTEAVKANGHKAVTDEAVPATCTEDGKTEGSHCSVCGEVLKAQETVAAGHRWSAWTRLDNELHRRVCTNDPTHVETEKHTWDEGTITKIPTCATPGEITYHCTTCGTAISVPGEAATGHVWGKWTNLNETQHKRVCANDPTHVDTAEHIWDEGKITKQPTAEEEGERTLTCTACGATKTEPIPKAKQERISGDVDGDGKLSSADARLALRASVGLEPDITLGTDAYKAADADGDGKVSSADARLILRASVGLEDPKTFGKKA